VGRRTIAVRLPAGAPVAKIVERFAVTGLDVAQRNESDELSGQTLTVAAPSSSTLVHVVRALDDLGIEPEHLEVSEPSLDDVFATLGAAR
jgi:hypothetical protein